MPRQSPLFYIFEGDKLIDLKLVCENATGTQPTLAEREVFRIFNEHKHLKAALKDCVSQVDADNLTMQTRRRNWQAVLNGKSWNPANIEVVGVIDAHLHTKAESS